MYSSEIYLNYLKSKKKNIENNFQKKKKQC